VSETIIKIEPHACKRARERFGVENDKAGNWIREQFATSVYIGDTFDKLGNLRRIFSNGSVLIVVNAKELRVHSVYKPERRNREIRHKVTDLVEKEARRIGRKLEKIRRESTIKIAELNVEIAEINLRKVKARSEAVKLACDGRIAALYEEIREFRILLESAEAEWKSAVYTKAAYV